MISTSAMTYYLFFGGNKDDRPKNDAFHGYACYLKQNINQTNEFAWQCKEFDNFKQACKFALQGHHAECKSPFKFVRVSNWMPRAFHRRILKHELAMPIHTLFPDEN